MESNRRRTGSRQSAGNQRYYIVEGSAARKTAPSPYKRQPEGTRTVRKTAVTRPVRPSRPQSEFQRVQAEKKRQVNQRIAMRNREKALKLDLKYTLFLGISVIFVIISCVVYLNLQNQMTQRSNEIASLKSQLNTLTDANVAARERISDAVNLDEVYQYATGTLGMVSPGPDQIITYRSNDEDYVKQFQDIPQSNQ